MSGNVFLYFYQKCHMHSFENKLFDGYQKRKIEISVFQIAASVAYFSWRIFPNSPLAMVKSSVELFSFSRSLPFVLSIPSAIDLVARRPSRVLYSLHAATFALKLLHPSLMRVSHRNPPEQIANTACSRVKNSEKYSAIAADSEQCTMPKVRLAGVDLRQIFEISGW